MKKKIRFLLLCSFAATLLVSSAFIKVDATPSNENFVLPYEKFVLDYREDAIKEAIKEIETDDVPTCSACEFNPEEDIEIVEEKNKENTGDIYIIGDSRSVGMQKVDEASNHFYTAKIGEGYKFFNQNYENVLKQMSEDDTIIVNLGVNDLYNIDKYISLMNSLTDSCKNVFVVTVNPVDEEKEASYGYTVANSDIDAFNKKLNENLDEAITLIDTNTVLKSTGFVTADGLHYTNDTYELILNTINETVSDLS